MRNKRLFCRIFALIMCLLTLLPHAVAQETSLHDQMQKEIEKISKKWDAVGVSAAYVRDGQVVDTFAYGYATRYKEPMTADTKVRVASITKVIVGIAAHVSAENGVMDLDASIDEYFDFQIRRRREDDVISARSILTHTSSIDKPDVDSGKYEDIKKHLTSSQAVTAAKSGQIKNWEYSNYAFYVLGAAIERANNKTMDQIVNEAFADKMQIDGSFWGGDIKNPELTATIYNKDHEPYLTKEAQLNVHCKGISVNSSVFAGNYRASVYDMGKIVAMLAADGCYEGEQIVSAEVVSALEEYIPEIVPGEKFYQAQPLRYRADVYGRQSVYYHTGSAYGENNLIIYDPVTKDGVVVLSTGAYGRDQYGIYAVCGEIADLLLNTERP